MSEKLFQFIWKHQLFDTTQLFTTENQSVLILQPGIANNDAGPDFLEAKIKIDSTYWVGNIELHLKSSDWMLHEHQTDKKYSNIILHVVLDDDVQHHLLSEKYFPTLTLRNKISLDLLGRFEQLMKMGSVLPCNAYLPQVNSVQLNAWFERLLVERFEMKIESMHQVLVQNHSNWQELLYIQIAKCFGLIINQHEFEALAQSIPLKLILKHRKNLFQLEALLFGQAGFLQDYFEHSYPIQLQTEYSYLATLYQLQGMEKSRWKFLRLRPSSFPTIRIAQFVKFLFNHVDQLFDLITLNNPKLLETYFKIELNGFWQNHYTLHESSVEKIKQTGPTFFQGILLNAIIPIQFLYGKLQAEDRYCDEAFQLLQELPYEINKHTKEYKSLQFPSEHAGHSQATLQLKHRYCESRRCLDCSIGFSILKNPV